MVVIMVCSLVLIRVERNNLSIQFFLLAFAGSIAIVSSQEAIMIHVHNLCMNLLSLHAVWCVAIAVLWQTIVDMTA